MHVPKHHQHERHDMSEFSAPSTTAVTDEPGIPPVSQTQPETTAAPISPTTVDVGIPASDPSDPASQPAPVQPIQPAGPSLDKAAAQQFALFQAWLASNEQAAAQAAASGAVTAGPSHHVYHSSVDIPEGVENAFQTSRGITLYVAEDSDGNTRTYAVTPNGSTQSVEGDVYDSVTTLATLLNL